MHWSFACGEYGPHFNFLTPMAKTSGFSSTLAIYLMSVVKYVPETRRGNWLHFSQFRICIWPYIPSLCRRLGWTFQCHYCQRISEWGFHSMSLVAVQLSSLPCWPYCFLFGVWICKWLVCLSRDAVHCKSRRRRNNRTALRGISALYCPCSLMLDRKWLNIMTNNWTSIQSWVQY